MPGTDTHATTAGSIRADRTTDPRPVRVAYRSFDRQWILPDSRLIDRPRRDLWAARVPGQVFMAEQHTEPIESGPGIVVSTLIPDFHHFNGRGGRVLPYLHPDGSPNIAPGLVDALTSVLGHDVSSGDVLAYVAGVVAHSGYTETFADELTTPGIRVPLTGDPALWAEAVMLGEQVIWLHSFGAEFTGDGRPHRTMRFPHGDPRQPLSLLPITSMPEAISYDGDRHVLVMGDGEFGPVLPPVWEYAVGGRNIVKSWFNYRKKDPGGRRTSPLNAIHPANWDPDWTVEAIDLLTVLTRLVDLEPDQGTLLGSILDGPLLSLDDLGTAGVRWPTSAKARKPRHGLGGAGLMSSGDD